MAKPKHKATPERVAKRLRDKASHIRGKIKAGKDVDPEEAEWLRTWDEAPRGVIPDAVIDPPAPDAKDGAPPPEPGDPPPPPPPPGAARPAVEPRRDGGDWRDRWASGDDGAAAGTREATCLWVARYWHGILKNMHDDIALAGGSPIVMPDRMIGTLVLATDQILPPDFAITPAVMAAAATSGLTVQRFLKRKEIAAAKRGAASADRTRPIVETPPTTRPAPPPADDPAAGRVAEERQADASAPPAPVAPAAPTARGRSALAILAPPAAS